MSRNLEPARFQRESSPPTSGDMTDFRRPPSSDAAKFPGGQWPAISKQLTPNAEAVFWKAVLSGLASGAAGTAAMTLFQLAWPNTRSRTETADSRQESPSTVKLANIISKRLFGRPLKTSEKEPASYAVHFAFGTLMGGLYGISSEYLPIAKLGRGLLHGIALWAGADATLLPALGLSAPLSQRGRREIAYEVLAHAAYGTTSEAVRRIVRRRLD